MFQTLSVIGIVAALAVVVLHYLLFALRAPKPDKSNSNLVKRLSLWERLLIVANCLRGQRLMSRAFRAAPVATVANLCRRLHARRARAVRNLVGALGGRVVGSGCADAFRLFGMEYCLSASAQEGDCYKEVSGTIPKDKPGRPL